LTRGGDGGLYKTFLDSIKHPSGISGGGGAPNPKDIIFSKLYIFVESGHIPKFYAAGGAVGVVVCDDGVGVVVVVTK